MATGYIKSIFKRNKNDESYKNASKSDIYKYSECRHKNSRNIWKRIKVNIPENEE
jgi:hypothetical protein